MERVVFGTEQWDHRGYVDLLQDGHRCTLKTFRTKEEANAYALKVSEWRGCECVSEDY